MHPLIFLATDLQRERRDAAARHSLARRAGTAGAAPRTSLRRHLATALAAVSLGSAAAVRRLDTCLADELVGRTASPR
jgi:hypothetical protein